MLVASSSVATPFPCTPPSADKNPMTIGHLSEASRILERQAESPQPWDWRAVPIERGFSEYWVVCAFVEPNQEPIALNLHDSSSSHEPLVRLLRFDLVITGQPCRQPAQGQRTLTC